jgi:hypothetical protein
MEVVALEDSRHHVRGQVSVFWTSQEEEQNCVSMIP